MQHNYVKKKQSNCWNGRLDRVFQNWHKTCECDSAFFRDFNL